MKRLDEEAGSLIKHGAEWKSFQAGWLAIIHDQRDEWSLIFCGRIE